MAPKKFTSAIWSPHFPLLATLWGHRSNRQPLNPSSERRKRWLFGELVPKMAIVETNKGDDLVAATGSAPTSVDAGGATELRGPKDLEATEPRSYRDASADAFLSSPKDVISSAGPRPNGVATRDEEFKRDMRDLEELLSKLNPMAQEFVPSSLTVTGSSFGAGGVFNAKGFGVGDGVGNGDERKKNGYVRGRRRMTSRTSMAQRDEVIRRTVYVSDIDHQVTEEQLATLFIHCGQVVDCRMCGDPKSVLRFAFIEFTDEAGAQAALSLSGTVLGFYPVRVLPSKTAIAPVNPTFLPRSDNEREMCSRTVYCTNIDKKVSQADIKLFFESICGEVYRLRLLGDYHHSTRIAFVEFVMAESATAALNCSGVVLGSLPIRVSPSKTPVRPRAARPPMH